MKKILSLILALTMALGGIVALADVRTPVPEVSQEALREAFLQNLSEFIGETDITQNALHLDVTSGGSPVAHAAMQDTDGVFDLPATVGDWQLELQADSEALYLSVPGQVLRLEYSQIEPVLEALAGSMTGGVSDFDWTAYRDILQLAASDVLLPFVRMDFSDGNTHISVAVDGEALSAALIRFGDNLTADERLTSAVALPLNAAGLLSGMNGGDATDYSALLLESWPQLREELAANPLPCSLNAGLTIEDGLAHLDALFSADEAGETSLTLTADVHLNDGSFAVHLESNGDTVDLTGGTVKDTWSGLLTLASQDQDLFRGELTVTDNDVAFAAALDILTGEDEGGTFNLSFDKAALTLDAELAERGGGLIVTLEGRPAEEGYRCVLTEKEDGETQLTATLDLTAGEDLYALDFLAFPGDEPGDLKLTLAAACAPDTGAYTLDYASPQGQTFTADGTLTPGIQTCHASLSFREQEIRRYEFEQRFTDERYHISYDEYQPSRNGTNPDGTYTYAFVKTLSLHFTADGENGAFRGGYEYLSHLRRSTLFDFEGFVSDEAFRLLLTSCSDYRLNGSLELTGMSDGDNMSAGFTYNSDGSVTCGNLLVTEQNVSLTVTGEDDELFFSLSRYYDDPTALRITCVSDGRTVFGLLLNEDGLALEDGTTRYSATKYTVTGSFLSETVWQADIAARTGFHAYLTLTIGEDALTLTVTDMRGEEALSATLSIREQQPFALLSEEENIVGITPELVEPLVGQLRQSLISDLNQ